MCTRNFDVYKIRERKTGFKQNLKNCLTQKLNEVLGLAHFSLLQLHCVFCTAPSKLLPTEGLADG